MKVKNFFIALVFFAIFFGGTLWKPQKVNYSIHVDIDEKKGILSGKEIFKIDCSHVINGKILLYLYPNRFSQKPSRMDAMTRFWIYPRNFDSGWIKITRVIANGIDITNTIQEVILPGGHPLAGVKNAVISIRPDVKCTSDIDFKNSAGSSLTEIEIDYRVKFPKRYNLFGRTSNGFFAIGGWYPFLVKIDEHGKADFNTPPPKADFEVFLTVSNKRHIMINDMYFSPSMPVQANNIHTIVKDSNGISLGIFNKLENYEVSCHGVKINYFSREKYNPPEEYRAEEEIGGIPVMLPAVDKPDRVGRLFDTLCMGVEFLKSETNWNPDGMSITVLEIPLRMELTSYTGETIFVSDRIYSIFPFEKFWKFHDFQVLRALFGHFFLKKAMQQNKDFLNSAMEADFCASYMVEKIANSGKGGKEYAEDILKWASFISSIDYLLYSPMVQFREVYFKTIVEKDWLRDEGWAFMNNLPRGKLLYEKLKDIVGKKGVQEIFNGLVVEGKDLESMAGLVAGEKMDWFFKQWGNVYPSLNYRIGKVTVKTLPEGKKLVKVEIFRDGEAMVKEPVVIRLEYSGGKMEKVWFESGHKGEVEAVIEGNLKNVTVDPEGRLFEDPSITSNNPEYDNAWKKRVRPPILLGASLWSSLYEKMGGIEIMFSLKRKYDLKNELRFYLEASNKRYGLTLWFLHGFGGKLDLNSSKLYFGPVFSGNYISSEFGYEKNDGRRIGATSLSIGFYTVLNNLYFLFDPQDGFSVRGSANYYLNIDDNGVLHHAFSGDVRAFYLYSFNVSNALAIYGGCGGTFFDSSIEQKQTLSGRLALRGFESDETEGRLMIFGAFEYRHLLFSDLGVGLLDSLFKIERIKGVLFSGIGTVSDVDSYSGMMSRDRIFAEAGYGIVVFGTWFGAYPGVLEFDVAVPVFPLPEDRSLTSSGNKRMPVGVYLSFFQTY